MSRNIKEIGKELLGKSLNSYHRRTGLTQLEKNNEMQDGILDGILSQVDDRQDMARQWCCRILLGNVKTLFVILCGR